MIRLAASHPEWVLGFADEVWWSRLKQPQLRAWTDAAPLRLEELMLAKGDAEPNSVLLRAAESGHGERIVALC